MPEWTTVNISIPTANKVRKLAFDRKRNREANPSTRETADELIQLGLKALRSSRVNNITTP